MTELSGHPINSVFTQYRPLSCSDLNYKNILQWYFKAISPSPKTWNLANRWITTSRFRTLVFANERERGGKRLFHTSYLWDEMGAVAQMRNPYADCWDQYTSKFLLRFQSTRPHWIWNVKQSLQSAVKHPTQRPEFTDRQSGQSQQCISLNIQH